LAISFAATAGIECPRSLRAVSDKIAAEIEILLYANLRDALRKALLE
jgi:hypothetical protein